MRNVGIYLFDDVEVLDFAGPFEVFSTASRVFGREHAGVQPPFRVFTVGASRAAITARGGLVVQPSFSFEDHPRIDVLLVPGGVVAAELAKPDVISWVAAWAAASGSFRRAWARAALAVSSVLRWTAARLMACSASSPTSPSRRTTATPPWPP